MIADLLIPLIAVGLAELGDKTQLSILFLSSKTEKHLDLFLGVSLAFLIVDGFAVLLGSYVVNIIPLDLLRIFSGMVFIIYGVLTLRDSKVDDGRRSYSKNALLSGFGLVFLTEWCDKTQIASGLLATKYDALMVLTGAMMALMLLSIMAIYLGKFISNRVDRKMVTRIAGVVFMIIGMSFLLC